MSNYNVGDIIRLTRQSVEMSQEELSDGICSVQTLSRIENGKVNVKKETYRKLMERMNRNGLKNYSILALEEFDSLERMRKINNLMFRREFAEAEINLNKLKLELDGEDVLNLQYIKRKEVIINYQKGCFSKEEYLEGLETVISLTLTDYKSFLNKTYPFSAEEVRTLMNIASIYGELEDNDMAIRIYDMLLRSLNTGYMAQKSALPFILIIMNGSAKMQGGKGNHQLAIEICWNVIEKSKKNNLFTILPNAYGEIAWNMMKQIEKGDRGENEKETCKKLMRQGYAIAALTKQFVIKDIIENLFFEWFHEKVYSSTGSGNEELSKCNRVLPKS